MLVLGRRTGERILIGDQVQVTLVRAADGRARIGVDAPKGMRILREELVEQPRRKRKGWAA